MTRSMKHDRPQGMCSQAGSRSRLEGGSAGCGPRRLRAHEMKRFIDHPGRWQGVERRGAGKVPSAFSALAQNGNWTD